MSTLEHLDLHSDVYIGLCPRLDLKDIHFPRLKTLRLGKFTFFEDAQLDWILSHASNLRELSLHDCTIIWAVTCYAKQYHDPFNVEVREGNNYPKGDMRICHTYSKCWHDYFLSFRSGLPLLRHFEFGWVPYSRNLPFKDWQSVKLGSFGKYYHIFDHEAWVRRGPLKKDQELEGRPACFDEDEEALLSLLRKTSQKFPDRVGAHRNWLQVKR